MSGVVHSCWSSGLMDGSSGEVQQVTWLWKVDKNYSAENKQLKEIFARRKFADPYALG